MVTQTSNQLSHEEALELLPWHVNSSLERALSEKVARHVQHCSDCQQESAFLTSTIVAVNSDEAVTPNLDSRFSSLIERVREHEQSADGQSKRPIGQRVFAWLGLAQPRYQWAGALALGLVVGVAAILVALQSSNVDPDSTLIYEVHSSPRSAPLHLLVEFEQAPGEDLLAELERAAGQTITWQKQTDTRYLIELPDKTTVKTVADIRSRLLSYDPVVEVVVDIADDEARSK